MFVLAVVALIVREQVRDSAMQSPASVVAQRTR